MVCRARVASHTDVPVVRPGSPGRNAGAGERLAGRSCSAEGVIQRNHVLLVQGSCSQRAHGNVERTILPEYIVLQYRYRESPTSPNACTGGSTPMALGTPGSRAEVRPKTPAVLHAPH